MILAFIGSEGQGKTCTAAAMASKLRASGHATAHIDGDLTRVLIGNGDYSPAGRRYNAWMAGVMARGLSKSGYNVLVSAVFPTEVVRHSFQSACGERVVWVHLDGPTFVSRIHGITEMESLPPNRCFKLADSNTIDYRVDVVLRLCEEKKMKWLSVIAVPAVVKQPNYEI
jgi:hypothetical protein